MLRGIMKKSTALVLACIFVLTGVTATAYASAPTSDIALSIISEVITDDSHLQIVEVDGIYYYFYNTPYYTITMTLNPNTGTTTIYHMNHRMGILTYEVIETLSRVEISDGAVFTDEVAISTMDEISNMISNGEISFNNVLETGIIEYESSDDIRNITTFGANDSRVIAALRNRGHVERNFRLIASSTQNGFTGRVYENTTFRDVVNVAWFQIPAQLTAAAVAAKLGRPIATVVAVFRFIQTVHGLVTAANSEFREFRLTVTYIREGRVNGFVMLSPGRMLQYTVVVGDQPAGLASPPNWESSDWNFNNTIWIAQEAIRLWRLNTGQ